MATEAIVKFGRRHEHLLGGPVLEIGAKLQVSYEQHGPREMYVDRHPLDWTGIDIEPGEGVDVVADLCDPAVAERLVAERVGARRFQTVHCHCVLEHVPDIFAMARAIDSLLPVGGTLFVSVPFAWKQHRIPVDFWRFTPQAIDWLFARFHFEHQYCGISTRRSSPIYPIDEFPELKLGSELAREGTLFATAIRTLRRLRIDRTYFTHRALLLESNLMMIGTKRKESTFTFLPSGWGA